LISVLFAVTIAIIALAAAVPAIKTQIKREREEELIHRAKQYTRAIQLYYRKYGRYPASVDQLVSTNNLRFLRQKYKDPITGKDEWKLLHFGEVVAKPRPAYLKGATSAGALGGSAGGSPAGGTASAAGGIGTGGIGTGGMGTGGMGTGTATVGTGTAGAGTGPGVANASDMSKPLSNGQTLGGGPIVGVSSLSEKEGLKEIDGKTKYNEWQFVYDPTLDRSGAVGGQQGVQGGVPGGVQGGQNGLNPGMGNPGMGNPGISTGGPTGPTTPPK
jgi:type II secretory pathway pseudopilin PulG